MHQVAVFHNIVTRKKFGSTGGGAVFHASPTAIHSATALAAATPSSGPGANRFTSPRRSLLLKYACLPTAAPIDRSAPLTNPQRQMTVERTSDFPAARERQASVRLEARKPTHGAGFFSNTRTALCHGLGQNFPATKKSTRAGQADRGTRAGPDIA